jgi:Ser/Thr protein kinase RdoA (MazF antagonist)
MLMDSLRGRPLEAVKNDLPRETLFQIRRQIGRLAAQITSVTGPLFGYPRRDGRTRSTSWRATFLAMVDDILLDATELNVVLPLPPDEIASLIGRHAPFLDEVTTPCLVHFDLWDGNIFVIDDGPGWRVEGIIDGDGPSTEIRSPSWCPSSRSPHPTRPKSLSMECCAVS